MIKIKAMIITKNVIRKVIIEEMIIIRGKIIVIKNNKTNNKSWHL